MTVLEANALLEKTNVPKREYKHMLQLLRHEYKMTVAGVWQ